MSEFILERTGQNWDAKRVVLHLGAHCTDDEALIFALRRNKPLLEARGVGVMRRSFFTDLLRTYTTRVFRYAPADPVQHAEFMRALVGEAEVDTVVLSYDSFLCAADRVFQNGEVYGRAGLKARQLRNAFPRNAVEFFLAVRNPATFLPALYDRTGARMPFDAFISGFDPREFRWSDVIARLRTAVPDVPVIVWANEDTPFLWREIMLRAAGLEPDVALEGELDIAKRIMTSEGGRLMENYLVANPPSSERARRRVLEAFLDKFVDFEAVEENLDLPTWTGDLISELTTAYEADMARIEAMPGVELLRV